MSGRFHLKILFLLLYPHLNSFCSSTLRPVRRYPGGRSGWPRPRLLRQDLELVLGLVELAAQVALVPHDLVQFVADWQAQGLVPPHNKAGGYLFDRTSIRSAVFRFALLTWGAPPGTGRDLTY
jgi:hypothetical protein